MIARIALVPLAWLCLHCGGKPDQTTDAGPRNDAGPSQMMTVLACDGLAGVGVFENITPPELLTPDRGAFAIAADPSRHGVVWLGSVHNGLYRSDDCGATWVRAPTGNNADALNSAMTWSLAVDPRSSDRVFAAAGYSSGVSGLYVTNDGGANWDLSWPPADQPEWENTVDYNFANVVTIDPRDPSHMVLTFHANCHLPPDTTAARVCFGESTDGGVHWRLIAGDPSWGGWESQSLFFLDRDRWLYNRDGTSHVLTFHSDARDSFDDISIDGLSASHLQGIGFARSDSGRFFAAGQNAIWRSDDGNAWTAVDGTGPIIGGIVSTSAGLFASNCYFPGFGPVRFMRSTDDGETWTDMPGLPELAMGMTMTYDAGHHVVYASGGNAVLRFRVE
jgi:hypothetical protein